MTPSQLTKQAFQLFISLLEFIYDWTIGLIVLAVSQDPRGMGLIHLILWIIILIFVIGVLLRLLWLLAWFFVNLFPNRDYGYYYRNPYFVSAGLAWVFALILIYVKFPDVHLP